MANRQNVSSSNNAGQVVVQPAAVQLTPTLKPSPTMTPSLHSKILNPKAQQTAQQTTLGKIPTKAIPKERPNRHDRFDSKMSQYRVDGAHLATEGDYREIIILLQANNKNLTHGDWKVPENRRPEHPDMVGHITSRLKILEFDEEGTPHGDWKEFGDLKEVKRHFQQPASATFAQQVQPNQQSQQPGSLSSQTRSSTCNLYILEGLDPAYISEIGSHLNIDPAFFLKHQRTALWEGRHKAGNTAKLASTESPQHSFMMEYCELLYFIDRPDVQSMRNPNDNRHINLSRMPKISSDLDRVGIMHRKASFWSSSESSNTGWNALIVVDPPLPRADKGDGVRATQVLLGSAIEAISHEQESELYQGGYLDFIPFTTMKKAKKALAPERLSIMDDICFYWENHKDQLLHNNDSSNKTQLLATYFLQKIIASNYMILVGYLEANLNELETAIINMQVKEKQKHQTMNVTDKWTILQSWSHRFPEYCGMIDNILEWHKLAGENLVGEPKKKWESCTADFTAIKWRLGGLRERTQLLSDSFVGLASMAGIQESLDEAKAVKLLAFLGFFFVPMSFVASIFAMPNHAPNLKPGFRHYSYIAFPIALGMTIFVIVVLWGLSIQLQLKSARDWAKKTMIGIWKFFTNCC